MVSNCLSLLVNQDNDIMSFRSQRGRVSFNEEIEMDSLEADINNCFVKGGVLCTIKEYEFIENEFEDENYKEFHEFDVSFFVPAIK